MNAKEINNLVASKIKHVGPKRLEKMSEEALSKILALKEAAKHCPPSPLCAESTHTSEELTKSVAKEGYAGAAAAEAVATPAAELPALPDPVVEVPLPHALPDGEKTKLIPSHIDGIALEVTVAGPKDSAKVFKEQHEIRVCSFNSLKLRLGRAGLGEHWIALYSLMATFDVVVVQELPAEARLKRQEDMLANGLKCLLESNSNDPWEMVVSEACGPGNLEVHVMLVRSPIKVVKSVTHKTACGVPLDHAPLSVKLYDERFRNEGDRTWIVTSVKLPLNTRYKDRDVQLEALLKDYERSADMRLGTPFTEKGAKDAWQTTVHHVICGDFNCNPGEAAERHGFAPPLLGEFVETPAGNQSYDNFLMSKLTANKFSIKAEVIELEILYVAGKGVSDHSPILFRLKDSVRTKEKRTTPKPNEVETELLSTVVEEKDNVQ